DLSRELAGLFDVNDRAELTTRLGRLLQSGPRRGAPKDAPARIVETALELAPRLGEAFGRDVLRRAEARFDAWEGPPERAAQFLEKALFLAAHFDQAESVKAFVERFRQLLGSLAGTPAVRHLDAVVGQCFRGLRKLG